MVGIREAHVEKQTPDKKRSKHLNKPVACKRSLHFGRKRKGYFDWLQQGNVAMKNPINFINRHGEPWLQFMAWPSPRYEKAD